MRKNQKKGIRLLAFLVTLGMLFGILPMVALAEAAESPRQPGTAVIIEEASFPDAAFRTFVTRYDGDRDGALSPDELAAVTEMDCSGLEIASLEGIRHFTELTKLDCSGNALTELSVKKTGLTQLDCSDNANLTNLTLNKRLKKLDCVGTGLESLDLSSTKIRLIQRDLVPDTLKTMDVPNGIYVKALSLRDLTNGAEWERTTGKLQFHEAEQTTGVLTFRRGRKNVSHTITFIRTDSAEPAALAGTATLQGALRFGETLTVDTTAITGNTGDLKLQWMREGKPIPKATDKQYTLTQKDIGKRIACVVTSTVETGSITAAADSVVEKADGPQAPEGLQPVPAGGPKNTDGKVLGTTSAMELATDEAFSQAVNCPDGEVANLAAGTYYIRVRETETHKAGAAAAVTLSVEVRYTPVAEIPASCEDPGVRAHHRGTDSGLYLQGADGVMQLTTEEDLVLPALGHDWGETEYRWTTDASKCGARRICKRDNTHGEALLAVITSKVTREPTETRMGETTYTAVFAEDWAKTQTCTLEDIPKKPHTHSGKKVPGYPATEQKPGRKDYYTCPICGKNFEDAACTREITALEQWGVIPQLPPSYDWSPVQRTLYFAESGKYTFDVAREIAVPHYIWQAFYGKDVTVTLKRGLDQFVFYGLDLKQSGFDPDTGHNLTDLTGYIGRKYTKPTPEKDAANIQPDVEEKPDPTENPTQEPTSKPEPTERPKPAEPVLPENTPSAQPAETETDGGFNAWWILLIAAGCAAVAALAAVVLRRNGRHE